MSNNRHSQEIREKVVELYKKGERISEIATECEIPESTVYGFLGQAGVLPNRLANRNPRTGSLEWAWEKLLEQERAIARLEAENTKLRLENERLKRRLAK